METIDSIKRSIKSADDLHSIVRTMKTLAAVNIRHYERAVEAVADYSRTVELALQAALQSGPAELTGRRQDHRRRNLGAVVFGSDQGLAGGFNDHVVRHAVSGMDRAAEPGAERRLVCVGVRAAGLLEERRQQVGELLPVPGGLAGITPTVQRIVLLIDEWQSQAQVGRILLFYNRPLSSSSYQPVTTRLLPLDQQWLDEVGGRRWPTRALPLITMERNALFSALVRQYIFVSLYRAFAESMASENAARLASMQAAEKNIEERLDTFSAMYRDLRQTIITSELLDIVGGFEAMRGEAVEGF